ncbi:MAG: DNA repair protein RecO [Myxococcota bacterium]|nr:DNA repair protein RecO [Myxococcota bacterium]
MKENLNSIQALVLRYTDYGESDRIVHLLTEEHGLICAMVRGARSAKKKYAGLIDLGNVLEVKVSPGKGELWRLHDANTKRSVLRIRSNIYKLALLSYACELCSHAIQVESPEPKIFGLMLHLVQLLEEFDEGFGARFRMAFELKLLTFAGYMPQIERCQSCGHALGEDAVIFPVEGATFHAKCLPVMSNPEKNTYTCTPVWRNAAQLSLRTPLRESIGSSMPEGPQWAFSHIFSLKMQKKLNAREFLRTLENS